MSILATVLAGLILLSLPFILLFQRKVSRQRKRELNEIKALVEERSSGIDKLHSRLDAVANRPKGQDQESNQENGEDLPSAFVYSPVDAHSNIVRALNEMDAGIEVGYPHTSSWENFYWTTERKPSYGFPLGPDGGLDCASEDPYVKRIYDEIHHEIAPGAQVVILKPRWEQPYVEPLYRARRRPKRAHVSITR